MTAKKMSKKGGILGWIAVVGLSIILMYLLFIVALALIEENKNYEEYKEFCEERPTFCICEYGECSFMIEYKNEIPTQNTKDYCEIAIRQKDKIAIFNGRCKQ